MFEKRLKFLVWLYFLDFTSFFDRIKQCPPKCFSASLDSLGSILSNYIVITGNVSYWCPTCVLLTWFCYISNISGRRKMKSEHWATLNSRYIFWWCIFLLKAEKCDNFLKERVANVSKVTETRPLMCLQWCRCRGTYEN